MQVEESEEENKTKNSTGTSESENKPDPDGLAQGIDESTISEESMNIQILDDVSKKSDPKLSKPKNKILL